MREYLLVLSKAERVVAAVERNELRLEEDVTVDGQAGGTGLETTEASCEVLLAMCCFSLRQNYQGSTHCYPAPARS